MFIMYYMWCVYLFLRNSLPAGSWRPSLATLALWPLSAAWDSGRSVFLRKVCWVKTFELSRRFGVRWALEEEAGNWADATVLCTNEHNKRASVMQSVTWDARACIRSWEGRNAMREQQLCRGVQVFLFAVPADCLAAMHLLTPALGESHMPCLIITWNNVKNQSLSPVSR